MTKFIKIYKLGHDEAFSDYPAGMRYIEGFAVPRMPDLAHPNLPQVLPETIRMEVYHRGTVVNDLIAREEHYALDPALRKFFEERCHQFMDVSTLLKMPAVSKAIENIRAEDSRTILQLQGEKQELERKLSSYQLIVDHLNDLCESFEKAPVWRRLWIALFPSRLCA